MLFEVSVILGKKQPHFYIIYKKQNNLNNRGCPQNLNLIYLIFFGVPNEVNEVDDWVATGVTEVVLFLVDEVKMRS